MAPPYLPRYAPIFNIVHPFVIDSFPIRGHYPCFTVLNCSDGPFGERTDSDKPLLGEKGFDHGLTTVTVSYGMTVRLDLL